MVLRNAPAVWVVAWLLLGGIAPAPLAAGCPGTIRFTGAGGTSQWELAANWDAGRLPTATDDVCLPAAASVDLSSGMHAVGTLSTEAGSTFAIQGGTLSVAYRSDLHGAVVLDSGSLAGGGMVVAHGPFSWRGGTMAGPGSTVAHGLTIEGDAVKSLTGQRTLDPEGSTVWTGSGALALQGGSKVSGSGSWDAQSDAPLSELSGGQGPALFDINSSTAVFLKSAGDGTKTLGVQFTNSGTTRLEAGTLQLAKGGQFSGPFLGSPGTTLRVSAGSYTAGTLSVDTLTTDGGTITAAGPSTASEVVVTSGTATLSSAEVGTLTLSGGTAGASTVSHLVQSGGTLAGNVTVTGPLEWTGGDMGGSGTTQAMAAVTISGPLTKTIRPQRVLETRGTTVCTGPLQLNVGATLRNMGTFELAGGATLAVGSTSRFENAAGATFRKSTPGSVLLPGYVNDGTIALEAGTLAAQTGGVGSGSLVGSPGSRLLLLSGAHTWGPGSSVAGAELTIGGTVSLGGVVSVPSTRVQLSGTLDLPSLTSTAALGTLTLSSGTVRVQHEAEATSCSTSGGVLEGAGRLRVLGDLTWTAGTMTDGGTTETLGTLTLSGSAIKDLTGNRVLHTLGNTIWTGPGAVRFDASAAVHNDGTWDAQGDLSLLSVGGNGRFVNGINGTFHRSAGAGTAVIGVLLENDGVVRLDTGTLQFTGGYTQTSGFTLLDGGTLAATSPLSVQGGSLGGVGTVAANVVTAGTLAPGLSPGILTIDGTYAQAFGGTLAIEMGGLAPGTEHDRLDVLVTASLAGELSVTLIGGFVPGEGDAFTVLTAPAITGSFASTSLPPLPTGLGWNVFVTPTSVELEVAADVDGDGVANATDCAPSDPALRHAPVEVAGVAFADKDTLAFTSQAAMAGTATVYDAVRGILSELPVGGAGETCVLSGRGTPQVVDATMPNLETAFYYLVRARNACGIGTYGTQTGGIPRTTAACP